MTHSKNNPIPDTLSGLPIGIGGGGVIELFSYGSVPYNGYLIEAEVELTPVEIRWNHARDFAKWLDSNGYLDEVWQVMSLATEDWEQKERKLHYSEFDAHANSPTIKQVVMHIYGIHQNGHKIKGLELTIDGIKQ